METPPIVKTEVMSDDEESYSKWVNTDGTCFLCLTSTGHRVVMPLRRLLRHLQIDLKKLYADNVGNDGSTPKEWDLKVDLCKSCGATQSKLFHLLKKLEKIQADVNDLLEDTDISIAKSAENPELMENFSSRLMGNEGFNFEFLDNIRTMIRKKCMQVFRQPNFEWEDDKDEVLVSNVIESSEDENAAAEGIEEILNSSASSFGEKESAHSSDSASSEEEAQMQTYGLTEDHPERSFREGCRAPAPSATPPKENTKPDSPGKVEEGSGSPSSNVSTEHVGEEVFSEGTISGQGLILHPPTVNELVYASEGDLLDAWEKATILEITDDADLPNGKLYKVKMQSGQVLELSGKQIAFAAECDQQLPVGTRVIAEFTDEFGYHPAANNMYYPGIVGETFSSANKNRYLIFYDNTMPQYVFPSKVRPVVASSEHVWADVHKDMRWFIKNYLKRFPAPTRPSGLVNPDLGEFIKLEDSILEVRGYDNSLIKVEQKFYEWIYRGLPRIECPWPAPKSRKGSSKEEIDWTDVTESESEEKETSQAKAKRTKGKKKDGCGGRKRKMAGKGKKGLEGKKKRKEQTPIKPSTSEELQGQSCNPSTSRVLSSDEDEY